MTDNALKAATRINRYQGTPEHYVGDDLFLHGHTERLEDWIYSGEENETSRWFEDKPHQILLRLLYIARRYQNNIPHLPFEVGETEIKLHALAAKLEASEIPSILDVMTCLYQEHRVSEADLLVGSKWAQVAWNFSHGYLQVRFFIDGNIKWMQETRFDNFNIYESLGTISGKDANQSDIVEKILELYEELQSLGD